MASLLTSLSFLPVSFAFDSWAKSSQHAFCANEKLFLLNFFLADLGIGRTAGENSEKLAVSGLHSCKKKNKKPQLKTKKQKQYFV